MLLVDSLCVSVHLYATSITRTTQLTLRFSHAEFLFKLGVLMPLNWAVQETLQALFPRVLQCTICSLPKKSSSSTPLRDPNQIYGYCTLIKFAPILHRTASLPNPVLFNSFFYCLEKLYRFLFLQTISDIQWLPMQMPKIHNPDCQGLPKFLPSLSLKDIY